MFYQLQIENCPNEELDTISEFLEDQGALSITLTDRNDNPVLEPLPGVTPLWPEVLLLALFDSEEKSRLAQEAVSLLHPLLQFSIKPLPQKDWENVWMEDFKPRQFGKKLWICPSWSTPPEPSATNLILDPGLAFGSGTHPTTALCLHWLEKALLTEKKLVDFGCGSGILALSALKLGARQVFAVDIDPQALQATEENARINQLGEERLICGTPDILKPGQDIIIANILLSTLIALQPLFHKLLHAGGKLVVSGLLREQSSTLIEACEGVFVHEHTEVLEDWALLEFTRL